MSTEVVIATIVNNYTERSSAVFGECTREIKDDLKTLGAKYNPSLTLNGVKHAGWFFSKDKLAQVEELLLANHITIQNGTRSSSSSPTSASSASSPQLSLDWLKKSIIKALADPNTHDELFAFMEMRVLHPN